MKRIVLSLVVALLCLLACSDSGLRSSSAGVDTGPLVLLSGAVAAYSFDQGSGSTAPDATGNGHTGTLVGGVAWTGSGKYGGALTFDGMNDRVTVADANDLDFTTAFSLLAWVRPTTLAGNWRTVVMKERSTNALAYALYANDGGSDPFTGYLKIGSNSNDAAVHGPATLPLNTWTHTAFTFGGGVMRLYRDGTQVATTNVSGSISATTNPLTIGGNGPWGEWFAGQIDEVVVYNRALSQSEIQCSMNNDCSGGGGGGAGGAAGAGGQAGGGQAGATAGGGAGGQTGAGQSGGGAGGAGGAGAGGGGASGQAGGGQSGAGQAGGGQAGTGQAGTGGSANLTVTGTQTFQTMDGFGTSVNAASWNNGEVTPALDLLLATGNTLYRVAIDNTSVIEPTNDNADPNVFNWAAYKATFTSAAWEELWSTLAYLNAHGIYDPTLTFFGPAPSWMGGNDIDSADANEYAEMMAAVVYYARVDRKLGIGALQPLNEPDWIVLPGGSVEGPRCSASAYAAIVKRVAERLDGLGLGDVRLLGPETAQLGAGTDDYAPAMAADSLILSKVRAFGFHIYSGGVGSAPSLSKPFWVTELASFTQAFSVVEGGAAAVLWWDGYDSVYQHAIPGNGSSPPNDGAGDGALLSYNTGSHTYTPRDGYYRFAQFSKFVGRGQVRVGVTESLPGGVVAFRHPISDRVVIVFDNETPSSATVTGSLVGLPAVTSFEHWRTSQTEDLAQLSPVSVSGGSFSLSLPANSMVTLTGVP